MSVYIVTSSRTPIAKFNGSYSHLSAPDLGSTCIRDALRRVNDSTLDADVDEVIVGQVFTCGVGQNPARQAAVQAGLPYTVSASTVNMVCGSGMRAVINGYQAIRAGDSAMVLAGGQESMTRAPHFVNVRGGSFATFKTGNVLFQDTMMVDGLQDAFSGVHMGVTAERVAQTYRINREVQDAFALASQTRALNAIANGHFIDEIAPICIADSTMKHSKSKSNAIVNGHASNGTTPQSASNGTTINVDDEHDGYIRVDECPRASTLEGLRRLQTVFDKTSGATVTAGNASGLADGAAFVLLASEAEVARRALHPQAKIVSWAQSGVDPALMGIGPVDAIKKALTKAGWSVSDVDLFEINEAFAATSLAVLDQLGLIWSCDKASCADRVNVAGGAIALGHPLGASGARLLVTLANQLRRTGKRRGVAALCIGGGLGIATCLEVV